MSIFKVNLLGKPFVRISELKEGVDWYLKNPELFFIYRNILEEDLRGYLDEVKEVYDLLQSYFYTYEDTSKYFKVKSPLLGNVSPYEMVLRGRVKKLKEFISSAMEENG